MRILKELFRLYQRAMFFKAAALAEMMKPLQLWNETLLIITYLAVRGINVSLKEILMVYVVIMIILAFGGKILQKLGILDYNTRLGNSVNPELLEIHRRCQAIEQCVTRIEQKLNG